MVLIQVIKKRYEAKGDDCQTDEFLKPIVVDPDGRIQGIQTPTVLPLLAGFLSLLCCQFSQYHL